MNVQFMNPHLVWVWGPIVLVLGFLISWYNLRALEGARKYWEELIVLKEGSPLNRRQSISLYAQWIAFFELLVLALAGPNVSKDPLMVPAGAVQVEIIYGVSPSEGAEDYRPFLPPPRGGLPDPAYRWGTRLDAAKMYTVQDLLPQLVNNEVGIVTVAGAGYNMWDITRDLAANGAFMHMHQKFVQVLAAPGGGCDFTSGLQTALNEFELISRLQKEKGDTAERIRFIVFFSDGGFTGSDEELDKVLDKLNEGNIRLLIIGLGGDSPVTVPKYDERTHRRTKDFFPGVTKLETKTLVHMRDKVRGAKLIFAPPGTAHIDYSFPEKAGGLYARAVQSNLRFWVLIGCAMLFASVTIGGGGLPRWKLIDPRADARMISSAAVSIVQRIKNVL